MTSDGGVTGRKLARLATFLDPENATPSSANTVQTAFPNHHHLKVHTVCQPYSSGHAVKGTDHHIIKLHVHTSKASSELRKGA